MKRKKQDKDSRFLLRVPNTPEGLLFLAHLREYRSGYTRIWARGRGPRAKHAEEWSKVNGRGDWRGARRAFDQDLPRDLSEYFAVYMHKADCSTRSRAQRERDQAEWLRQYNTIKQLNEQVSNLRHQVSRIDEKEFKRLDTDRAELIKQRDILQSENSRLRNQRNTLQSEVERLRKAGSHDGSPRGAARVINLTVVIPEGQA